MKYRSIMKRNLERMRRKIKNLTRDWYRQEIQWEKIEQLLFWN